MSGRRRHRQRLLSDLDALHALLVALAVLLATAGLAYVAYLVFAWRTARRAGTGAGATLLVFGKHCREGRPDADFRARLQRAHALAMAGAVTQVLLLGGGDEPTEAAVAARELRVMGLPVGVEPVLEDESRDTLENLRHAKLLLGEDGGRAWLLSNRYHLARCGLLADCVGLAHELCAAEDVWQFTPKLFTEAALLMWIDIGRRWARLIRSRRMLAKLGPSPSPSNRGPG
jgi:uncharacterized SAM-binding protein YcdF (DUF218 family)